MPDSASIALSSLAQMRRPNASHLRARLERVRSNRAAPDAATSAAGTMSRLARALLAISTIHPVEPLAPYEASSRSSSSLVRSAMVTHLPPVLSPARPRDTGRARLLCCALCAVHAPDTHLRESRRGLPARLCLRPD